jgi:heme o synthase
MTGLPLHPSYFRNSVASLGWRKCGSLSAKLGTYAELAKPRITMMVLFSTAVGYVVTAPDAWRTGGLLDTLLATGVLAAGTAALNQWYEHETDAAMRRTCRRPIPSGRVSAARGLAFGLALSTLGLIGLVIGANVLAAAAGLLTLTSYLLLYTPLKQRSSACVFVGAFAGAMPPIIGSIAANGHLKWSALALFGIMFVWQVPHVYAIALIYRNDYARGGLKMLPARSGLAGDAGRHIVVWSLLLILTSLAPVLVGIAGAGYTLCALILGVLFAYQGVRVWAEPTVQHARSVLLASVMYLPTLLVMTVIDATARRLS